MSVKKGKCVCGKVALVATDPEFHKVGACHCGTCRNWGGPFLAIQCAGVEFENENSIGVYDSSDWAERGFCKHCGSHLFYRLKESQKYFLSAGLFQDSEGFEMDHQVFIDEKPDFYTFSNKTHDMTGAEIFAKYND